MVLVDWGLLKLEGVSERSFKRVRRIHRNKSALCGLICLLVSKSGGELGSSLGSSL